MEAEKKNSSKTEAALNIEVGDSTKGGLSLTDQNTPASTHTVDHDSWMQVGLLLVTSFNSGWTLSFSYLILVHLGWTWGIICLVVVGLFTAYANWLLAGFHFINGQRFIRYRDLMGFLFGRKLFYITWVFQFMTLLLGNMGTILLGGRALKEINSEFSNSPLRLQYFIIMTGAGYFIFSFMVPTISAMRKWLAGSAILTFAYILPTLVLMVKDGKSSRDRDYEISGTPFGKTMNAFGAISAIIVCNTSGLLLEIQSTLRRPAKENMRKALYLQYIVGLVVYYGVTVVGYWAYGSEASDYIPTQLGGSKWVKVLINAAISVQFIVAQQMFIAPVHEALDTKFLKAEEGMHSRENIKRLFYQRAILYSANTLVAAAFPFIGDFVNFIGSFALVPLTFIFPSMIFIKVKGKTTRPVKKVWHWTMILVFSLVAVATTISAIRLIVESVKIYHFFADT